MPFKSSSNDQQFQVALCTAPDISTAELLAEKLVEAQLAACVNLIPNLTSVYEWQGAIEKDPEVLLVIKTEADLVGAIDDLLHEHHPYEVFELICCDIEQASEAYLEWMAGTLSQH